MRRQQEGWHEAERRLRRKNMRLIAKWKYVSHAVDIGNLVKQHYRQFSWHARGNLLRTNEASTENNHVKQIITDIINKENEAHHLAEENKSVQNL